MFRISIVFVFTFITSVSFGQGCGLVSSTKNKETGVKSIGGIVNSKDFYSLLINKRIDPNNLDDTLNYSLFLHAASKVLLSDSLLKTKGIFELILTNGKVIHLHNAECLNDPLGLVNSIGFIVKLTENQISETLINPIIIVKVFGILETKFSPRKQKQQQKIVNCLINH